MKTQLKFLFIGLFFLNLLSCSKDTDPNEDMAAKLDGNWEVVSLTVDGVEQMGFTLNSFTMDFEKENAIGGETDWLLIDILGGSQKITGDFEVQNDGREVDIDGDDLDISITGERLDLDGNIGGERWEIEADRE